MKAAQEVKDISVATSPCKNCWSSKHSQVWRCQFHICLCQQNTKECMKAISMQIHFIRGFPTYCCLDGHLQGYKSLQWYNSWVLLSSYKNILFYRGATNAVFSILHALMLSDKTLEMPKRREQRRPFTGLTSVLELLRRKNRSLPFLYTHPHGYQKQRCQTGWALC